MGRIVLAALVLAAGILGGGGFLLLRQVRMARAREQEELQAIALLKAGQISDWYGELVAQSRRQARNPVLQDHLGRFLAGEASEAGALQVWADSLRQDNYHRIAVFDLEGRLRLLSCDRGEGGPEASEIKAALVATGERRDVWVRDLHREAGSPAIYLDFWVPLGNLKTGDIRGCLLLQVDSAQHLEPLVSAWPARSATAEAQLVRREQGDAVYLNELRHQAHAALNLRIPIAGHSDHPAVKAALGQEGLVSGADYRELPVLAAVRRVPGTPWALVAKMDASEVYAPARREAWIGGSLLLGLSALVVVGAGWMLRERQLREAREYLRLERAARSATERYGHLMEQASDIILLFDLEGRILEANPQALASYGYSKEEMLGRPLSTLRSAGSQKELSGQLEAARAGEVLRFDTFHIRRDGSVFPVEVSTRKVTFDGRECLLSFVRDISDRRARDLENRRMTQLYSALSQVNQAIVWSKDREGLLAKICEVLVTFGQFNMAWIASPERESQRVRVEAQFGDTSGYLQAISVDAGDPMLGAGPVGTALREDCPSVFNDFLGSSETAPWHEAARQSGFESVASFPIHQGGKPVAALAVYSKERDFFGPHEVALLEEAAMDVSFALDHLAGEERRRQAEDQLRESERFLREAEEAGGVGCYTWDIHRNVWKGSAPMDRIFGIGPDHPRDIEGWASLVAPSHREAMQAYVGDLLASGSRFDYEYPIIRPENGALRWLHGSGELRRDAAGLPLDLTGVIRDVTEWKDRERELERMTRLYAALSQVNLAIVRSRSCEELLARICEAMVEFGRFSMAWFGWDDPDTHQVRVAAQHGDRAGYLEGIEVRSDGSPAGQGPTGQAIRTGVPVVVNDFLTAAFTRPWHEKARRCGFAASAAFPVRREGKVVAAFMVYAPEPNFFREQEMNLLEEAAGDVSFALDHLAGEARRVEAEEALRRQKDEFETIFNRVPSQIWYKDTRNRYLRVNEKACRDLGFTREQIEGHTAEELFPEFAADYYRDDLEVFATGQSKLNNIYRINTANGRIHWLRTDKVPILDPSGKPVGLLAIVEDFTEWRSVEESLRTVYLAMEQSPVSVVITDPKGSIQYVNPAFTHITGYTFDEVLGKNPRVLKSGQHPPEFYRDMWATLAAGRVWSGEIQNRRKDGELFTEMATISPVRDDSGALVRYVAIKEDITERKRAEAERRKLEAQIEQTQRLENLGSLAGGLAHDMNNVLGAILGLASMLREKEGEAGPSGKALDTIVQACMRGRSVVKSLLYFARKDLQEERPIDLNALVQEMTQLLSHTTLQRVRLDVDLQEGLAPVRGDGGALSHALMNLCVNALDAMPGGGTLRITTAAAPDGSIELRVKDTGEGMPEEVLAHCLDPFYTTKPRGKGTGLGLPMVQNTMKAHEGAFEIHSRLGAGTEAILVFPSSRIQPAVPEAAALPAEAHSAPSARLRVLLVDDDELVRDSVTELLGVLGHQALAVPGGLEALQALESGEAVDLVLLDLNMPGMSGAQTLPRILALRPGLPVLLATGYSNDDLSPLLEGRPKVGALSKPFTASELKEKIAQLGA